MSLLAENPAEYLELCDPDNYTDVRELIRASLNPDVSYSKTPTDLRNQRVYAIQVGDHISDLDVA